ncbi:MAG: dihydroorotase [Pseudomonadota bacterium]
MSLVLSHAHLIDPEGREGAGHVRIEAGLIADIAFGPAPGVPEGAEVIDCMGHCLAPGIVDLGVKVCEPGERHKESFRSAGLAAARGGVTTMVTRADTDPAIDTPEILAFVHRRAIEASVVRVLPMAALTKGRDGREMVEIGFLRDTGAVAFSDGDRVVTDARVLQRCMTYAAGLGALVIGHAQEPTLSAGAAATSGAWASRLGLPAVGTVAERMQLARDLALVETTGVAFHVDQLSTAAALPILEAARDRGLDVTAGASIHHLTLNELDIADYRTFFKLKPPLRAEADREALVAAVASGAVDLICSMHTPQDEESKRLPFEAAASGAVGLETLLPAALQLVHAGALDLPTLFARLALAPAARIGSPAGRLAPGAPADLVLFDKDAPFVLDRATLASKSKNTPFDQRRMQGRVLRTLVGGETVYRRDGA